MSESIYQINYKHYMCVIKRQYDNGCYPETTKMYLLNFNGIKGIVQAYPGLHGGFDVMFYAITEGFESVAPRAYIKLNTSTLEGNEATEQSCQSLILDYFKEHSFSISGGLQQSLF